MPQRLLYVDDDRINVLLFEELCRVAGDLEVHGAGSGSEALAMAADAAPDVLVIDLHLPDTDGYALLPRLRAALGRADLPAFLCTAEDARDVQAAAAAAGFTGCWTKPVDLRALRDDLGRLADPPAPTAPNTPR